MPAAKSPRFTGEMRKCRLPGCNVHFAVPIAAKNKEFCEANHRLMFHSEERKKGLELLRHQTLGEGAKP